MKRLLFTLAIFSFCILAMAQSAKTDSIFNRLNLKFSPVALNEAKRDYELANDTLKAIMLKVYSLPMSSRRELIANYEERHEAINNLKNEFLKVVPKGYKVSLDIELSNSPLKYIKSIDLQIFKNSKKGEPELIDGEWDLEYESDRFNQLLNLLKWDAMTFSNIKNLMQMANCISIENGKQTEIGFARSGLGKYFYVLLPSKIKPSTEVINQYNDGCQYLYYRDNIVLKYEGGMAGPPCFTD